MPGVKIGKGAIVGACSMVTRSVPDHAMVSGNPAGIVQENVIWKC
jgi:acetyltransferase-like isoleucine patch superfamily enzyme